MYFTSTTFHSIPSNKQPFFSSIRPGAWGSKGGVATDQCQLNSSNLKYQYKYLRHIFLFRLTPVLWNAVLTNIQLFEDIFKYLVISSNELKLSSNGTICRYL